MAPTYLESLGHFTNFLTAYVHTILYLRGLYPRESFVRSRFHDTAVYQSRHPLVCEWITDAIKAVREELLASTVSKIGIVIYWHGGAESSGSVKIMERYMLDVSGFPVVEKGQRNTEIEWEGEPRDEKTASNDNGGGDQQKGRGKTPALDRDVDVDMSEQFRAALVVLTTRCSKLQPLPKNCSYNISMELKDESDVDPPIRHPKPWIPVQPSLQKTGRKGRDLGGEPQGEGQDLGGVRTTPIRSVSAGIFRFETWIEEGKAKFDLEQRSQSSLASSGG